MKLVDVKPKHQFKVPGLGVFIAPNAVARLFQLHDYKRCPNLHRTYDKPITLYPLLLPNVYNSPRFKIVTRDRIPSKSSTTKKDILKGKKMKLDDYRNVTPAVLRRVFEDALDDNEICLAEARSLMIAVQTAFGNLEPPFFKLAADMEAKGYAYLVSRALLRGRDGK